MDKSNTLSEPKDAEQYFERGKEFFNKGYIQKAIENFDKAIEINPQHVWIYNHRGVAKKEFEQYKEAIEDFDKAVEIEPRYALAYHNRGRLKDKLGLHEEAKEDFDKVIEIDIHNVENGNLIFI